jgi:hypothetical protein
MIMDNIFKLKEILDYNPITGFFTWKVDFRNHVKKGRIAGHKSKNANNFYICIHYQKHTYYAHRLAWVFMTGKLPNNNIDHINGIGTDNKWCNLRCVPQTINARNRSKATITSLSGITGIRYIEKTKKWIARIYPDSKLVHIGTYDNKKSAIEARWLAEIKYNYPNCFTMSSAYLFLKQNSLKINVRLRLTTCSI